MAKEIKTAPGFSYVLTCTQACTVEAIMPDGSTMLLCSREDAGQVGFYGISDKVSVSDDAAQVTPTFKPASPSALGGGVSISFDDLPTAGSQNAVTSNGIYLACRHAGSKQSSLLLGDGSEADYSNGVVLGVNAKGKSDNSVVIGYGASIGTGSGKTVVIGQGANIGQNAWSATVVGSSARAIMQSVAIGNSANAAGASTVSIGLGSTSSGNGAISVGAHAVLKDRGAALLYPSNPSVYDSTEYEVLEFVVFCANSPLAIKFCNGNAGMGFISRMKSGEVLDCGVQALKDIMKECTTTSEQPFDITR